MHKYKMFTYTRARAHLHITGCIPACIFKSKYAYQAASEVILRMRLSQILNCIEPPNIEHKNKYMMNPVSDLGTPLVGRRRGIIEIIENI